MDKTKRASPITSTCEPLVQPEQMDLHDRVSLTKGPATRARAIVKLYMKLSGSARYDVVVGLLSDLMHLCDRDRRLGGFEASAEEASWLYEQTKKV